MTAAQQSLFDDVGLVEEESHSLPRQVVREDQPIYRYHAVGPDALSTAELLALVLGCSSLDRAAGLLATFGSLHQLARASHAQLMRIMGIGEAQAARLRAIIELSRRLQLPTPEERLRITCPADAANLLIPVIIVTWNILSATIFLLRRIFHERYLLGTISPTGR
ncbi:MAG: hypothetical protein L0332_34240, partial [Chloroflexi bacterium]|nr:hypothetical protein [Chloroflexota bacterium]